MSLHALAAYIDQERQRAPVTTREIVTTFRAYLVTTMGPGTKGEYKLTLGTSPDNKDAVWELTNHQGEFFEIEVRTVRVHTPRPVGEQVDDG